MICRLVSIFGFWFCLPRLFLLKGHSLEDILYSIWRYLCLLCYSNNKHQRWESLNKGFLFPCCQSCCLHTSLSVHIFIYVCVLVREWESVFTVRVLSLCRLYKGLVLLLSILEEKQQQILHIPIMPNRLITTFLYNYYYTVINIITHYQQHISYHSLIIQYLQSN